MGAPDWQLSVGQLSGGELSGLGIIWVGIVRGVLVQGELSGHQCNKWIVIVNARFQLDWLQSRGVPVLLLQPKIIQSACVSVSEVLLTRHIALYCHFMGNFQFMPRDFRGHQNILNIFTIIQRAQHMCNKEFKMHRQKCRHKCLRNTTSSYSGKTQSTARNNTRQCFLPVKDGRLILTL